MTVSDPNPVDYIYHASIYGEDLPLLNPYHSVPYGDLGDGIYLSNLEEESLIWGASNEHVSCNPTLNVYNIDNRINNLYGKVIDSNDDCELLIWATSISYCRIDRIYDELSSELSPAFLQYVSESVMEACVLFDVSSWINQFDWIISRRSDDGLWRYIIDFFSDTLSLDGLREVYDKCSFGDQLVLKTQDAADCLTQIECQSYDKGLYAGVYRTKTKQLSTQYKNILSKNRKGLMCHSVIWGESEARRVQEGLVW